MAKLQPVKTRMSFWIWEDQKERLEEMARRKRTFQSIILRDALDAYLKEKA